MYRRVLVLVLVLRLPGFPRAGQNYIYGPVQARAEAAAEPVSDMSRPAVSTLHQAFRNSFAALESNQRLWRSGLAECTPLLGSLGNLAEQLRALSNMHIPSTPLGNFPELEERLRFKLHEAVDTVLEKLNEKMCCLQSAKDAISNQLWSILQLYEQNATNLDLQAVTERSAVTPSVADMMEWLQDAERFYRQQFLQRNVLLQTLRPKDLALLESFPERWKSLESPDGEQRVTETLCRVSFFLELQ